MRNHADRRPGHWLMPLLAGAVLGPAVQVQQASLWPCRPARRSKATVANIQTVRCAGTPQPLNSA